MVSLKQSVSWFSLSTFCEQELIIVLFYINFTENLLGFVSLHQLKTLGDFADLEGLW
jgi:hypothetical protein